MNLVLQALELAVANFPDPPCCPACGSCLEKYGVEDGGAVVVVRYDCGATSLTPITSLDAGHVRINDWLKICNAE